MIRCAVCEADVIDCRIARHCPEAATQRHAFRAEFVGGPWDGRTWCVTLPWIERPAALLWTPAGGVPVEGVPDEPCYVAVIEDDGVMLRWTP